MTETQDAVLRLPDQFALCIFIRVLSDCCRPLHLVSDDYCFSNASKKGADGRVMGIASAFQTAPAMGRFFYLHQMIYSVGAQLIKVVMAGGGQLLICPCSHCPGGIHGMRLHVMA